MYTIIGGDGKEYGPVSAEQVRQWIATGRANGQTLVKAMDATDWKPLADFPEFDTTRPLTATPAAVGPAPFDPLECFSRSWQLLRANFWPLIGVSLLPIASSILISVGLSHSGLKPTVDPEHPFAIFHGIYFPLTILLPLLITQPLSAGVYYYILKRARGESAGMADLFAGYTQAYVPLLLTSIVMTVLITLGFLCLIVPGIYLGVAYSFARLAVIDRGCGFWTGLELSRRAISQSWWSYLLLLIIGMVVLMIGVVALGIGVFVAMPVFYGAMAYAYLDLTPPAIASAP